MIIAIAHDIESNPGPKALRELNVCHANIRSLSRAKLNAIKVSLADMYDVITLSETHLHNGISNDLFELEGYHDILRKDRNGNGGGVAVYIRDTMTYKRMFKYETADIEAIWIQLNTIEGKILLCSCYRPPDNVGFWNSFQDVINEVKTDNAKYIFVLGDLNADFKTINGRKLVEMCTLQNLNCMVHEPTRITDRTATVLDQIVTNCPNFIKGIDVSPPVSTSDHCTVAAQLNFKIKNDPAYQRTIWQYKDANFQEFRTALLNANFDDCFVSNDVNEACNIWTEIFLNSARTCIPNRVITIRPKDSPWYNNALRKLKRRMQRCFRKYKQTNSDEHWTIYKNARNEYQRHLNEAEIDYNKKLSNTLATSKNQKKWWNIIKSMLGKGKDTSYPHLNVNNQMVTDSEQKATEFNKFFLSHSNIDLTNAQLPGDINFPNTFDKISATEQDVHDLIKCLDTSKSSGPDGISPRLLKEAGMSIVPSLTKLINLSLSKAEVPAKWKVANVLPLFKKGDKSNSNNYRPVSLLSCVSKIMERVVFKYLFNFIRDHQLISPHQSGFQPGDSTVNQLSFLYHTFCEALDHKKDVQIVFCDISKAFDRVWHEGLLYKLKKIGLHGDLLQWFKSYLSDRQQSVVIKGQKSNPGRIKAGVPQGSVLGPLLFLIYINDLMAVTRSNIKLFADDTSLYIDFDDANVASRVLNEDLQAIQNWADQWLINFCPNKTKLMTCSYSNKNKNHPQIKFNNVELADVDSHKHLGLTLSRDMTWTSHINSIIGSVAAMSDVLKSLKYKVDRKSLEITYFSFIRPKLEYGSHIWDNCSKVNAELLEKFQLDVARTVTGARKGTSHDLIYNETCWPKLSTRRTATKLKSLIKIACNETPQYLQNLLPPKIGESRPSSRYADNYQLVKCRTETFKKSFIPSAVKLWNTLPFNKRNLLYAKELSEALPNIIFYEGSRELNVKHAQLRMHCSKLNSHLFQLHVSDTSQCACGQDVEDSAHYLLNCTLYNLERVHMFQSMPNIVDINNIDISTLLYGNKDYDFETNKVIFQAVQSYILETNRL